MNTLNPTSQQPSSSEILVKASATPFYAFTSLINLGMILTAIYVIIVVWFVNKGFTWIFFLIALPFAAFLIYYIWAILSRTMEIRGDGVKYDEALTKRFFKWEEIESVLIERWKKQITFDTGGREIRIHYIGVHPKEFAAFKQVFLNQIQGRSIPLVEK